MAKKRSPKRRIDFKDDEPKQSIGQPLSENNSDDGTASWADMVKNGYQRPNNTSGTHGIVKSKENDNNLSKHKRYNDHKENTSKDNIENSKNNQGYIEVCGSDVTQESLNSSFSSTITEVTNLQCKMADKKAPSSEFSGMVVDATNMEEDEGWEVVSRSRGRPSRRGFYKVQSATSAAYGFPVSSDVSREEKKGLCKQSHGKSHYDHRNIDLDYHVDNNDPGGSHDDSNPDHVNIDTDHHHDGNSDPDCYFDHHDDNIDPDQLVQNLHDNTDSDHHGDNDPDDAEDYCDDDEWQHQVVKESDLADEDNIEIILQRGDDNSVSMVDNNRVVTPDIQVSKLLLLDINNNNVLAVITQ